jgi:hypothetical protein
MPGDEDQEDLIEPLVFAPDRTLEVDSSIIYIRAVVDKDF